MRKPRVVVITGASAGVGRAAALQFARHGANLALIARNREALEAARAQAESYGVRALVLPLDVADADAVERAAQTVEAQLGPIDVWVNDAMVTVFSPVSMLQPEEVRRVTEVTYLGTVHGTLAALRRMLARNRGVIVQVGSALSYRAIPLQAAYCGAKFAIRGFTSALRTELLHTGSRVHVTMVQMPAVNTPQFDWCRTRLAGRPRPVPPVFDPEVAARAIYWSARHRRRELFVGGSTVAAIWGNRLVAPLLDHYLARTAYASQVSREPVQPDRPDNLWKPVPGDRGARGRFTAGSYQRSTQLWLTTHRHWLLTGGLAALALTGIAFGRARRRHGAHPDHS
ncbi:MAG TPA: SDR family oxidoreductase [Steroidobacteraceae bacterium]|jgi:short-subunit dehydrogenase|nr:SDR family oxidoreductase [Steroidobacteraceae bacterium]